VLRVLWEIILPSTADEEDFEKVEEFEVEVVAGWTCIEV